MQRVSPLAIQQWLLFCFQVICDNLISPLPTVTTFKKTAYTHAKSLLYSLNKNWINFQLNFSK